MYTDMELIELYRVNLLTNSVEDVDFTVKSTYYINGLYQIFTIIKYI